jgi:hypothetical protein
MVNVLEATITASKTRIGSICRGMSEVVHGRGVLESCDMGQYDTAQVCLNGHVITDTYYRVPQFRQDFCSMCGQATVHQCKACGTEIRGDYYVPGVIDLTMSKKVAPSFCHGCGKPHPWTAAKILAAQAMADEVEGLNDAERVMLKASIEQIASDTPMTEVAVTRIKKLIPKVAKEGVGALRRLIIDVAGKTGAELMKGG